MLDTKFPYAKLEEYTRKGGLRTELKSFEFDV